MSKELEPIVVPQNLKPHPLYNGLKRHGCWIYTILGGSGIVFILLDLPSYKYLPGILIGAPMIVGLLIVYYGYVRAVVEPFVKYVDDILDKRSILSDLEYTVLWGDKKKADIARRISDIYWNNACKDKKYYFIPEDSFAVMNYAMDLTDVNNIIELEKEFDVKFDDDSPFIDMSLADVVEYIIAHKDSKLKNE